MNVFDLVKRDLDDRNKQGHETYGGPLNAYDSSRDWLVSAYEEVLDLAIYLRAEIIRRQDGSRSAGV